jgi:hypothetical protein
MITRPEIRVLLVAASAAGLAAPAFADRFAVPPANDREIVLAGGSGGGKFASRARHPSTRNPAPRR